MIKNKEELNKILDEDLIIKDFPFGVPDGLGSFPAEAKIVSALFSAVEMQRRLKNATNRASNIMIFLNIILVILTLVLIFNR